MHRLASADMSAPLTSAAPASPPQPAPAGDETTRAAGRGGLAIAVAKVSFILFGFVQQALLPHVLGVDKYGEVSRVLAIVGIVNNVVVAVGIQGVSRAVSSAPPSAVQAAFAATLRIHTAVAAVLGIAFAALAGRIADSVNAGHVELPLRIVGAVVLLYGTYAPLVGGLNGMRRFLDQAGLDIGYGLLRTCLLLGGAVLATRLGASGVVGASVGFVAAAGLIVPVAIWRSGLGRSGPGAPSLREHLTFVAPLAIGQIFLNLLLQTDFVLLSRFVGEAAQASGAGEDRADTLVGVYRGVQLFSFLPYQLLMSVTFVLFPMLARAHADSDCDAVARFTKTGVRLAFVLTGLSCGTVSALAPHLLHFAFPVEIAEQGGPVLRILSLGMGAFAILGISCTALTSVKRETTAAILTAVTVALVAGGCSLAVPRAELGQPMLLASAVATSVAMTVAAIVGGVRLYAAAGAFVSPATVIRVGIAVGAAMAAGWEMPWLGKLFVPIQAVAVALVYVLALVLTAELGRADIETVRAAFGKKRAR